MQIRRAARIVFVMAGLAAPAAAETFPAPVEAWRSLIADKADGSDVPVDFLLMWVRYESYGNPCALGVKGHEAGIAQTWHPDDDRFGATYDELRAPCVEDKQETARPLTGDEKDLQVTSLVAMVKNARDAARAQMARAGVTWPETSSDFWKLVKLRHALPAWGSDYLVPCARALGHPPATFGEFRTWIESLSDDEVIAINKNVRPFAPIAQRRRLFDNAEKTGVAGGDPIE
jgi:hypothetical protein